MLSLLSLASLAAGTIAACFPSALPVSRERAECIGGVLLILGFALVGIGLSPLFR